MYFIRWGSVNKVYSWFYLLWEEVLWLFQILSSILVMLCLVSLTRWFLRRLISDISFMQTDSSWFSWVTGLRVEFSQELGVRGTRFSLGGIICSEDAFWNQFFWGGLGLGQGCLIYFIQLKEFIYFGAGIEGCSCC